MYRYLSIATDANLSNVLCCQVSYDGVPFLLHDHHTIRTTDVETKCPNVDPLGNATWLNFSSGTCPLDKLNVGSRFTFYTEVSVFYTPLASIPFL